jgi:hypothetical protein
MRNNRISEKKTTTISQLEGDEAYKQAQRLLQDLKEGYVSYDRLFTSADEARDAFDWVISGEILGKIGISFYWKQGTGEPMILYGTSTRKDLIERGLIEICRLRVPDVWVGAGHFCLDWPETDKRKDDDPPAILITLYLDSPNPADLDHLVSNPDISAYLASIFFEKENALLFNNLAQERFESVV